MNTCKDIMQRRVGRCHLVPMTVIVVVLGIIAVIVVVLSPWTEAPPTPNRMSTTEEYSDGCLDVAVIGAGIGGAYTGWRLKDRGLAISVFEYSDRVGGRLFSVELPVAPGSVLEMGGMRFKSGDHPILNRTATEIGLNIIPFELGYGNADETVWYTRGMRMRSTDLGTSGMPYNLNPREMKDPTTLLWDVINTNINLSSNTYPSLVEMYSLTTRDGTPMYKMTMDNFYGRFTSRETYKYIHDTSGWADSVGSIEALRALKRFTVYPGDTGHTGGYQTIAGGMGMVPKTLMRKFTEASTSNKLHLNHQLMKIEKTNNGGYHLNFRRTKTTDEVTTPIKTGETKVTVCARKVILAAQKRCIEDIYFSAFWTNPEIVKNIDSVVDYPAGRVYLAYNTKWWKTNNRDITHSKSDLPTRQTYDWSTATNNVSIIMASFHDGDLTHYWRELGQFGIPIPGSLHGANTVTDVVKERLEKYLSLIYNYRQEDIPEAVGGGMMLWDSYPFYAAWTLFKPGFDERRVREIVQKPSLSDDVYIVSNSWAADDMQGWSEATLIAVDQVIHKYF